MIVDVDAHHYESESYGEITEYIEDPIFRNEARTQGWGRGGVATADGQLPEHGRPHHPHLRARQGEGAGRAPHRDIALTKRWMDAMGIDSSACSRRRC